MRKFFLCLSILAVVAGMFYVLFAEYEYHHLAKIIVKGEEYLQKKGFFQNKLQTEQKKEIIKKIEELEKKLNKLKKKLLQPSNQEKKQNKASVTTNLHVWAKNGGKFRAIAKIKKKYGVIVAKNCQKQSIKSKLVIALIAVESDGKLKARSSSKAYGLMQVKKSTAKGVGVHGSLYQPENNIKAGVKYLKFLKKKFGNDVKMLAAYSMGPNCLKKKIKKGFAPENYDYVQKIIFLSNFV